MADKPVSTCHPPKPAVSKAGLCAACYHKQRRSKLKASKPGRVLKLASSRQATDLPQTESQTRQDAPGTTNDTPAEVLVVSAEQAIRMGEEGILLAVPEAVMTLRHVMANSKDDKARNQAALAILREYPLATAEGSKRLLEQQPKSGPTGTNPGNQVVIGLYFNQSEQPGQTPTTVVGKVVGTVADTVDRKKILPDPENNS